MDPDSPSTAKRMREYIEGSKRGLKNLQTTYTNDKAMVALIDVILDSVQQSGSGETQGQQ